MKSKTATEVQPHTLQCSVCVCHRDRRILSWNRFILVGLGLAGRGKLRYTITHCQYYFITLILLLCFYTAKDMLKFGIGA